MTDLIAFLQARLDEQVEAATFCVCSERPDRCPQHNTPKGAPLFSGGYRLPLDGWLLIDPAQVLLEVGAKRAILEHHAPTTDPTECSVCFDHRGYDGDMYFESWPCRTVLLLITAFQGHPDYPVKAGAE